MARLPRRWPYWGRFATLTVMSLGLLFFFVFGFLPQRFLLELDFAESGFAFPVIRPPLPVPPPPPPPPAVVRRPVPRGPAERFWAEYVTMARSGYDEGALRLIVDYVERHPDDYGARLELGRALWRAGRLHDAVTAYRTALAEREDEVALLELARLHVAARDWDGALTIYEQRAAASPDDLELLREYAAAATWGERYVLSYQLYVRLVALDPGDPELRLDLARVLYWSDRPEAAALALEGLPAEFASPGLDTLRSAIAAILPPPDTFTLSLLEQARGLAMAGAADSALTLYRLQLSEEPGADSLLLEMADVFEYRVYSPDSTAVYLSAYLARDPDDADVRLRRARLMTWSGSLAEAELETEAVVKARPDDAAAWALLGDLRRWRGDRTGAAQAYQQSLELSPEETTAVEGLAVLDAEIDAELAARGTIGPAGHVDVFSDSDEFGLLRWRGAWTFGGARTRTGIDAALERLEGFDPMGPAAQLTAVDLRATAQRWWLRGGLLASASLGAWIPEAEASVQPVVELTLAAPDWQGAAVRFEYRHGPAYRETATLEAALSDLRADVAELGFYRPIAGRWDMSASGRLARFSGVGDPNLRADASLAFFFKPDDHWVLGYESRALTFRDPAPNPGRRLYWDPEWSWTNSAVLGWRGEPGSGWELEARAAPGVAWLQERGTESAVVFELGASLDARRRFGVWTVGGGAGYGQSRLDGYRTFRLGLEVSRGVGR